MITWHNIHKGLCYSKQIFSQRIENTTYWLFKCFDSFTAICKWGRWNIHKQWANLIGSEAEFDCRKRSPVCPFVCLSFCLSYTHKHKHSCSHMHLHAMHPRMQVKSIRAESRWWTHTRTRTHTNTQMHAHTHAHTRARTHTHARIHTQTCGLNYGKAATRCQWQATAKRTPTQSYT